MAPLPGTAPGKLRLTGGSVRLLGSRGMERHIGFEPMSSDWKSEALPLDE